MPKPDLLPKFFLLLALLTLDWQTVVAQTTAFTYQGKLTDSGNPANGNYDFQFRLFDALSSGTQQGATLSQASVTVSGGIFNVTLDFGTNVFTGAARFLEIGVRPAGSANPHTVLSPRQPITSSPYAIQTVNAEQLGGLPANRYVATDANGKVGIGTATPSTTLEVVDPVRQLRFGPTTADNGGYLISTVPHQAIITGGAKWDAPNWIARDTVASMTAHQFGAIEFYTNSGLAEGNPFSPAQRMVIEANGNVAIGTPSAAPGYKVDINSNGGGVRSFYNGSTHFVAETTGGTNAWAKFIMKTPNRQWAMGTSQNFNGDQLYIADETAGQIRMAIQPGGGPIYHEGNLTQDRSSYGLPKAMVEVYRNGSIVHCYNAITGSSSGTCGFSAVYLENSDQTNKRYEVNFGFDVRDRFFSATPRDDGIGYGFIIVNPKPLSDYPYGEVVVHALYSPTSGTTRSSFYLVVY